MTSKQNPSPPAPLPEAAEAGRGEPAGFLYFDLGNVLLFFDHPKAARQMAELAGLTQKQVWEIVFDSDLEIRYERGDIDCREFYDEFCRRTGSSPDFAMLKRAAAEIFEPNQAVIELVETLHARGRRLGVLSNTCAAHWEYCLDGRYPFLNRCFETYALSYELKAMKPEAIIYSRAAELAGVVPGNIFFVDDRPENVAAACAAGYDAVLYHTPEQLAADLAARGVL
jgi:HAD superfamily hydrolase (TIGR01509 family)